MTKENPVIPAACQRESYLFKRRFGLKVARSAMLKMALKATLKTTQNATAPKAHTYRNDK